MKFTQILSSKGILKVSFQNKNTLLVITGDYNIINIYYQQNLSSCRGIYEKTQSDQNGNVAIQTLTLFRWIYETKLWDIV